LLLFTASCDTVITPTMVMGQCDDDHDGDDGDDGPGAAAAAAAAALTRWHSAFTLSSVTSIRTCDDSLIIFIMPPLSDRSPSTNAQFPGDFLRSKLHMDAKIVRAFMCRWPTVTVRDIGFHGLRAGM
jgi:hypothetical protein